MIISFLKDYYDFLIANDIYDPSFYSFDTFIEETKYSCSSTMADALFISNVELELQPENTFIGWCYKNDKWIPLIEFLIENKCYTEHYLKKQDVSDEMLTRLNAIRSLVEKY